MDWGPYECFSVLSGLILLAFAFVPQAKPKDRLWAALGGIIFTGYGFYVANQTSGTYYFSVVIFVITEQGIPYFIYALVSGRTQRDGSTSTPPPGMSPLLSGGAAPRPSTAAGAIHSAAGLMRDGAVLRALEAFGKREWAGVDPHSWTSDIQPLAGLRDTAHAVRGKMGSVEFVEEMERRAVGGGWQGFGVWRF